MSERAAVLLVDKSKVTQEQEQGEHPEAAVEVEVKASLGEVLSRQQPR